MKTIEAMKAPRLLRKWPTILQLLDQAPVKASRRIATATGTGTRGVVGGEVAAEVAEMIARAKAGVRVLDEEMVASAKRMWVGGNGSEWQCLSPRLLD